MTSDRSVETAHLSGGGQVGEAPTATDVQGPGQQNRQPLRRRLHLWSLTKGTVAACFRYRITGLAAEAAFFALVSLPPLLLGLVGSLGYFTNLLGSETIRQVRRTILDAAATVLADSRVEDVVAPTIDSVIYGPRPEIISIGFLIALWAGSRALNVYVDTITIAYGLSGRRGIVRTRLLSFSLYVVGLVVGIIVLPLVVAGPDLVDHALPAAASELLLLYWPVVVVLSIVFLTTLYHLSVPVRTPWVRDLPGAVIALVMWVLGSFVLRGYLLATVTGPNAYGSLAAPVAVLFWLYVTGLAVLIGAALNAQVDRLWPHPATVEARRLEEQDPDSDPGRG